MEKPRFHRDCAHYENNNFDGPCFPPGGGIVYPPWVCPNYREKEPMASTVRTTDHFTQLLKDALSALEDPYLGEDDGERTLDIRKRIAHAVHEIDPDFPEYDGSRELCRQKAGYAQSAIDFYQGITGDTDLETSMYDLLADMMHLADEHDLSWDDLIDDAGKRYEAEKRGEH